jgi:diadenosine tetraphosphate (Ap4A) HIT family hydrolase
LHLHVFPRFVGDAFEDGPIDPHRVPAIPRTADEIEALRDAIANAG